MIYGSVCSGIEAATQAWHPLGWMPAFFSEIEKFPSAVLAHHYGSNMPGGPLTSNGVPNLGDMTKFKEWPDYAIDLLVGGTPCQSFSVAGLRKGLADPRGNLMLTYLALLDRYTPRWCVWENVPGVLSSESHSAPDPCPPPPPLDLGCDGEEMVTEDEYDAEELHGLNSFLAGLSELGYGFAYRVLDAQYVRTCRHRGAVPQRRRRVFVVGYLGDWRRAAAVLFDRESMSGNPPPRREAGQVAAPTISARPTGGGGLGTGFDLDGGLITSTGDVAHCPNAGGMGRIDYETETMVAHTLRGEGFDASEDGTGRGTPIVPVAYRTAGDGAVYEEGDATAPLTTATDPNAQIVAFDLNQITSKTNRSNPDPAVHHTLPATSCPPHLATAWAVRRLTPNECHRLQGFPDGFCDIPWRGKDRAPDGAQYTALGNSMAVNVMAWIGSRIQMVEDLAQTTMGESALKGD